MVKSLVAAAVVLLSACGTPAPPRDFSSPATSSTSGTESTPRVVLDIVVSPDAPPPRTAFNESGHGPAALTEVVVSSRVAAFEALPGFVDGQYNRFSGDGGALLLLALQFNTQQHAAEALDLYIGELGAEDGYGLPTRAVALGDDGVCGEGAVPTPLGEEAICIWRNGNLVLAAGGELADDGVRAAAHAMDARAR
jgi:hypothetical protein